ncbi:Swap70, partial [Symbiodinium microadriaticum]
MLQVLSWLSQQGLFPIEFIVHVDPDFFKRIMPEWKEYLRRAVSQQSSEAHEEVIAAGTFCHRESAFLQEIAMEAAMSERQNVWIDGSLSNGPWFSMEFDDIRKRFPHYRIAIIYITASEATVRARIAKRSRETGRNIPESEIVRSLQSPEESIRLLSPKTDLVIRITNESTIKLSCVEDYSGNWHQGLYKHFGVISHQHDSFPDWLGPLYFANTSLVGEPFVTLALPTSLGEEYGREILTGFMEKEGHVIPNWKSRWFVLTPGKLSYYSKVDKSLRGDCVLTKQSSVRIDDSVEPSTPCAKKKLQMRKSNSGNFLMTMLNGHPRYIFTVKGRRSDGSVVRITIDAGSVETRIQWVEAIE